MIPKAGPKITKYTRVCICPKNGLGWIHFSPGIKIEDPTSKSKKTKPNKPNSISVSVL
jgi:hypothetical protein